MQALMTLWGLEEYMQSLHDSLFTELTVPDGADKDVLIATILDQFGEFEVADADPNYIKVKVGIWSKQKSVSMLKAWKALTYEYAFQDNYDRDEQTTVINTSHAEHHAETGTETTGQISAYDSTEFQNHDKATHSGEDDGTSDQTGTTTTSGRIHGNIGVTTTMALLREEMQVAPLSFYEEVAKWFGQQFCLLVY